MKNICLFITLQSLLSCKYKQMIFINLNMLKIISLSQMIKTTMTDLYI